MKSILAIVFCVLFNLQLFAQNNRNYLINEFNLSINSSMLRHGTTKVLPGFGAGAYHSFFNKKRINLLLGLEFNRVIHYKYFISETRYTSLENINFRLNTFSIPLSGRLVLGNKVKFLLEAGIFSDLLLSASQKGTRNMYPQKFKIDEKIDIPTFNYGISGGIGIIIPSGKHEFIVKTDYKYGVRDLYNDRYILFNRYARLSLGVRI